MADGEAKLDHDSVAIAVPMLRSLVLRVADRVVVAFWVDVRARSSWLASRSSNVTGSPAAACHERASARALRRVRRSG